VRERHRKRPGVVDAFAVERQATSSLRRPAAPERLITSPIERRWRRRERTTRTVNATGLVSRRTSTWCRDAPKGIDAAFKSTNKFAIKATPALAGLAGHRRLQGLAASVHHVE